MRKHSIDLFNPSISSSFNSILLREVTDVIWVNGIDVEVLLIFPEVIVIYSDSLQILASVVFEDQIIIDILNFLNTDALKHWFNDFDKQRLLAVNWELQ